MDSISQLVLGAAVGEALLGKKLGNKAVLWGAVGGTIPDLDVLASPFLTELGVLTFHRGLSHSLLFSVVFSILLGWLISKFNKPTSQVSRKEWQFMLFVAFFTHIILDCFTLYGTQVFAPFSNYRISWGTISVADPLYTIPLLFSLLAILFIHKTKKSRRITNYLGLVLSSLYLLLTVYNKSRVEDVFINELAAQNIEVSRMITSPTLFNNILWSCTAESDDAFYVGIYSFYDTVPVKFYKIEKRHDLLINIDSDKTIKALRWMSDNYFCIREENGELFFNDLRWARNYTQTFISKPDILDSEFVFSLQIEQGSDGYELLETVMEPVDKMEFFTALYERVWGIRE